MPCIRDQVLSTGIYGIPAEMACIIVADSWNTLTSMPLRVGHVCCMRTWVYLRNFWSSIKFHSIAGWILWHPCHYWIWCYVLWVCRAKLHGNLNKVNSLCNHVWTMCPYMCASMTSLLNDLSVLSVLLTGNQCFPQNIAYKKPAPHRSSAASADTYYTHFLSHCWLLLWYCPYQRTIVVPFKEGTVLGL